MLLHGLLDAWVFTLTTSALVSLLVLGAIFVKSFAVRFLFSAFMGAWLFAVLSPFGAWFSSLLEAWPEMWHFALSSRGCLARKTRSRGS